MHESIREREREMTTSVSRHLAHTSVHQQSVEHSALSIEVLHSILKLPIFGICVCDKQKRADHSKGTSAKFTR